MAAYINGFSVEPYGSPLIKTFVIPGTSNRVRINLRAEVAPILVGFAADFQKYVEVLDPATTGGHNPRHINNDPSLPWSFHAPGIAEDLNWSRHPMGRRGTFSAAQVSTIRTLLTKWSYKGKKLIRWGADFTDNPDEMHFEIIVDRPTALEAVRALQTPVPTLTDKDTEKIIMGLPILNLGATGPIVKRYQALQNAIFGAGLTLDGVYGPKCQSWQRGWQSRVHLPVTGRVDKQDWAVLVTAHTINFG